MSAAEIIEHIRALPREEQAQVVDLIAREFAPEHIRRKNFADASAEVFTEYRDVLAKLAK